MIFRYLTPPPRYIKFFGGFYLGLSQVVVALLGFAAVIMWTKLTTKEDYGLYVLLMSYIPIISLFAFSGSATALEISSSKRYDGNYKVLLWKKYKAGVIASLLFSFIIGYHYILESSINVLVALLIIAIIFPVRVVADSWIPWSNGRRDYKRYACYRIFHSVSIFIFTIIMLIYIENVAFIVPLIMLTYSLTSFIMIRFYNNNLSNNIKNQSSVDYGVKISGAFILNGALLFDKALIAAFSGLADLAIYGLALSFVAIIKQSFDVINKLLTPKMAAYKNVGEGWPWLKESILKISGFYFILGVLGVVFVDNIIYFFFGEKYISATDIAVCFWVLTCLAIPSSIVTSYLRLQRKTAYMYIAANTNATFKLVVMLVLVPILGVWGVVIAHSISLLLMTVLSFFYVFKYKGEESA